MASSNKSGKGGTGASAPPEDLIARLGLPVDARLIDRALTHRSYAYENGGLPTNERLEFLGDSVLGLVVTDTLYTTHSELPEGQLAKLRSAVVNSKALAEVARGLRLGDYVKLGRGEETTGGRDKASILADTLEALIGSVYLDHGIEVAFDLVRRLFGPLIATSATLGAGLDWKTSLQELTAVAGIGVPDYRVTETGPDHDKFFEADACVAGEVYGHGSGRSKKEAEQQAAEEAWRTIRETHAEALAAKGVLPGAAGDRKLTHGPYDIEPDPADVA
ncbi:ribonuclease-3 [Catenulispora sp. GAS73]|uniref:ribonuclease III n=1 Tax=Catenulispora sp. GAS73 TaxID=3156269 RepID=UPI00351870A6